MVAFAEQAQLRILATPTGQTGDRTVHAGPSLWYAFARGAERFEQANAWELLVKALASRSRPCRRAE